MKLNELFKMVTAANKLNQLLDEEEKIIEIRAGKNLSYDDFETFTEFKKWINEDDFLSCQGINGYLDDETIKGILNADYQSCGAGYFEADYIVAWNSSIDTISVHIY